MVYRSTEYGMYGIAEAMDYNRVIAKEASLKEILDYGKEKKLKIDGHAPGVIGTDLDTYIAAGVSSDHESVTVEEMLEKFHKGMYVILRLNDGVKMVYRSTKMELNVLQKLV